MNLNYLNNKSILITGGTGSFGENFIKFIHSNRKENVLKIIDLQLLDLHENLDKIGLWWEQTLEIATNLDRMK